MLNPVIVPFWSTTTGGSTRVTTRSSEVLVWAVADAPTTSSITNTIAIRPNIPAIKAPLTQRPARGGQVSNDGQLSPCCQGGGRLAVPLDRIVTVSRRNGAGNEQESTRCCDAASIASLRELAQIRRRLILARRHQHAILSDEIGLLLEDEDRIVLLAEV